MRRFIPRNTQQTEFERPEGMPQALHRLLMARGIGSAEEARAFLRPDASMMHDPAALRGIPEAAELIRNAVMRQKKICVYGDYDVDGVSASSILYLTLRRMGADPEVYLPSRHTEGYGLNETAVRAIAARCDVLVTVDCGITNIEPIRIARELGLETVVTDHHRPGEAIPEGIVVDPLIGDYPEPYLCGGGVALKLSQALLGREAAMEFSDIAALATVADIVPLTGENRVITRLGLDRMNRVTRLGFKALQEVSGMEGKPFTSGALGFQIGPRLNAAGRLGSAKRAFELLTCQEEGRARALAVELNAENTLRKQIETEIMSGAEAQLEDYDLPRRRAIVLAGEGWNSGVIGLAASRLVEKYYYPVVMISLSDDVGVASCRSIPGVDIFQALSAVGHYFLRFGGHAQAAGFTIGRADIDDFRRDFEDWLGQNIPPSVYIPVTEYDVEAKLSELDLSMVRLMDAFAPTGMGNPAPVFYSRVKVTESRQIGSAGAHLSLRVTDGTTYMRAVAFKAGDRKRDLPEELEIAYAPKINDFAGRSTVELEVKAFDRAPAGEAGIAGDLESCFAPFLTEVLYNKTIQLTACKTITPAELKQLLLQSPQGTLIVAGDTAAAAHCPGVDVYFGRYPQDPRAFNALCILPPGKPPAMYRRVVWAGLPGMEGGLELQVPRAEWTSELPGVDELRRAYVAAKRMLARPVKAENLDQYAMCLADECSLSETCLKACVLILMDLDLVRDSGNFRLKMGPFKKIDPATSQAFRNAQKLKEEA